MARAREVPGLDCDEEFARAAERALDVRAAEVFEHREGVLDVGDAERVHDMRVATRRLRAALEMFAPCYPRKRHRRALGKVKALADALGERRDRDVAIELLEGLSAEVAAEDRGALSDLVGELRVEQARANVELAERVAPRRLEKLRSRLRDLRESAAV